MNPKEHLILNNGKDITTDVEFCKYNQEAKGYDITFRGGKAYSYGYNSIDWVRNPEKQNPSLVHIVNGNQELINIREIYIFCAATDDYWHIVFSDRRAQTYPKQVLKITYSCLAESEAKSCLSYLRKISSINNLKSDEGEVLLQKQYEKLSFVGKDTAMAVYMNPETNKIRTYDKRSPIFPFGGNASQFQAVRKALNNQISVIQGPPGTGKTQTILNIIANLMLKGASIQIVSNNNSATKNVFEKLASSKYNMGFLVAFLGSSSNKTAFVQNQNGVAGKPDRHGQGLARAGLRT